jgi:integrase
MKTDTETTGTADTPKTWERTKTPGLLRHRSGRYYARFTLAGKTRFVALKTDLAEIARIRFAEEKAKVERTRKAARKTAGGVASMGDLANLMRDRIGARTVSEHTKDLNRQAVAFLEKTWDGFAKLRPSDVTPDAVATWRDRALAVGTGFRPPGAKTEARKGASASSVNKAIDMLRRMLDVAADMGAIAGNPLAGRRGIKAPDKPHKPKLPEAADLERLFAEIEAAGGRGTTTGEFCRGIAYTGCRVNEAAALLWRDIDDGRGVVRVAGTKTEAAAREVPLIPAARALFAKIRARRERAHGSDAVAPAARVFMVSEAQRSLDRACAKVGVPRLTHHDLRDAFATACIEAGVDVPTVAAWLGHADGGALLMRVYAHHRRAHSVTQAAKVTFGTP